MNTFSLLEVELPEPSCCHLYLSPISHPLQFCVSDSGACVKSVRVLWRSPLCREPARGCIPSHLCIFTTQPCWFQKACPLSRRSTLPLSSPSPHLQVVLCVCSVLSSLLLAVMQREDAESSRLPRCSPWLLYHASIWPEANFNPQTEQLSVFANRMSEKVKSIFKFYFPAFKWGFHVYIGHLYYSCSSELPVFALGSSLTCRMFWCNQDSKLLCFLDKYFVWLSVLCRILC